MKIKTIMLSLAALTLASTQAFSYVVYNQTGTAYRVNDKNFMGMDVTVPAYSSAACSHEARGCWGNMDFIVYSPSDKVGCRWKGKIDNGTGYYYVITSTGRSWPFDSCRMELYRDNQIVKSSK